MTKIKISEREEKILRFFAEWAGDHEEGSCTYTRVVEKQTGIEKARRYIRSLVRKGLLEYHRGLFDDDGMVAGSGYCISTAGEVWVDPCDIADCNRRISYKFEHDNGETIRECQFHYEKSAKRALQKLPI